MLSGQGHGAPTSADGLLARALDQAVTLTMDLRAQNPDVATPEQTHAWRCAAVARLVACGDAVRYGGQRVADTFGVLTVALAMLAEAPGGVTFLGQHWCTDHMVCEVAAEHAEAVLAREAA